MDETIEQFVQRDTSLTIAAQVVYFRQFRGMTQRQLADACGIEQSALARLERTPDSHWTATTLNKLAAALDVRISVDVVANEDARPLVSNP